VDKALRLVYCSSAWDQFAVSNDGDAAIASRVIGTNLLDVVPEPLKRLYDQLFAVARDTRQMWPLDYECSSAKLYRLFRMEIRPMRSAAGFVLVHALRVERLHGPDRTSFSPNADRYSDSQGQITMCAHCRKTRRVAEPEIWDWVPEYVSPGAPRCCSRNGGTQGILTNAWEVVAMTRRTFLLLTAVLAFALVSLATAQQQDQPSATPNPLVQRLQNSGVVTAQEAAAINQAPTPAEQQDRLTQLLRSQQPSAESPFGGGSAKFL